MTDDAVREVHGVKAMNEGSYLKEVIIHEREDHIKLDHTAVTLTPWQARYLARKLYHLARRIEARTKADQS